MKRLLILVLGCMLVLSACGGGGGGGVNSTLDTSGSYLQLRCLEGNPSGYYSGWLEIQDNGQLIQESDVQTVQLFDPNGLEVVPAVVPPAFMTNVLTVAEWNDANSEFESIVPFSYSGFFFQLTNQASLPAGTYSYYVQMADGEERDVLIDFPVASALTPISSGSMAYQWNPDNSLTLSWTEPVEAFDRVRIYLYDNNGTDIFIGKVDPGVSTVTLSATLIQQLNATASLPSPTTIGWRMQTRLYDIDHNYSRSITSSVPIAWP